MFSMFSSLFSPDKGKVRELLKAAEQGDAEAQFNLGVCYYEGKGIAKDEQKAVEWYLKAADQGHVQAQYYLGCCCEHGKGIAKDEQKAVEWYRKAADREHAQAQYYLGCCYEHGKGIAKDERLAVECYQKAAAQGYVGAQYCLSRCYGDGIGVGKNEFKAGYWCQKAAEQGDAEAQYNLGYFYEMGIGVENDEKQAVYWYREAAKQGDARAEFKLGVCHYSGTGVEKDEQKAVKYYQKAAEQGYAEAHFSLGISYQYEIGTAKDERAAVDQYKLVITKADSEVTGVAQNCLGWCYEHGIGVDKNPIEAVKLYESAAIKYSCVLAQYNLSRCYDKGIGTIANKKKANANAILASKNGVNLQRQYYIGWCFRNGRGVKRNLQEARRFFELDAARGNKIAQKDLREITLIDIPYRELQDLKSENKIGKGGFAFVYKRRWQRKSNCCLVSHLPDEQLRQKFIRDTYIFCREGFFYYEYFKDSIIEIKIPPEETTRLKTELGLGIGDIDKSFKELSDEQLDKICRYNPSVVIAVKSVKEKGDLEILDAFKQEVDMLLGLRHPNIVLFYGACQEPNHYSIIIEYMENGSLDRLLYGDEGFSWPVRLRVAIGIAEGLHFLHSLDIIHRDLKSPNVLLDKDCNPKLADFGAAKEKRIGDTVTQRLCTTINWASPEQILGMGSSKQSDIYSYGVILWEIATRKIPYEGYRALCLFDLRRKGQIRLPSLTPSPYPSLEGYGTLVENCWKESAEERPSADQARDELKRIAVCYTTQNS